MKDDFIFRDGNLVDQLEDGEMVDSIIMGDHDLAGEGLREDKDNGDLGEIILVTLVLVKNIW